MTRDSDPYGLGSGWTRARIVFLSTTAAGAVLLFWLSAEIILPFILALIVAYVLTPPVALLERKTRIPRSLAIVTVYTVTFAALYLSVAAMAPRIYLEARELVREAPAMARQLSVKWGPTIDEHVGNFFERGRDEPPVGDAARSAAFTVDETDDGGYDVRIGTGVDVVAEGPGHWRVQPYRPRPPVSKVTQLLESSIDEFARYARSNVVHFLRVGQTIVSNVSRGVFLTFMSLMVAGYIINTRERIIGFFRDLFPVRVRPSFDRLLHRMDRGLSGVVRGQLLICAVNGLLSAIGFIAFDLKYWPILAVIAGMMSIIPIFGSILSTIPAVLVGLTQGFLTAFWVLVWILAIHQVEANLLNPKIIGVAAKLHPVLVVFSLVLGEHLCGLWGALLAVPVLSVTQSCFNHFRFEVMPDNPPDSVALESRRPPPMPEI